MSTIKFTTVADGELYKWTEPGQKVEGLLQSYKNQSTSKGEGHVYEVKTKEGVVAFFAPSLLHQKLQTIPTGRVVSIEYLKEEKTNTGNTIKRFNVGHAEATEANLKVLGIEVFEKVEDSADDGLPRFDQ